MANSDEKLGGGKEKGANRQEELGARDRKWRLSRRQRTN
jgi:hypothetical protein